MRNALFFQEPDHIEQVLAKPLQQVHVQPAFLAEPVSQRLRTGPVHEQAHPAPHFQSLEVFDDVLVPELLQDLTLVPQPIVVRGIAGHLEDQLLAVPLHQEGHGTGAGTQSFLDHQAAGELIVDLGLRGILDQIMIGTKQFPLDLVQTLQEITGGIQSIRDVRVGAVLNEELQVFAHAVDDRADLQAFPLAELLAQFQGVGGGWLTGVQVVSDGAQGEDVEVLARGLGTQERFGSQIGRTGILDELIHVDRAGDMSARGPRRGPSLAIADLPVEDLDLRPWKRGQVQFVRSTLRAVPANWT